MKNNRLKTFLFAFVAVLFVGQVSYAQFDDLYYEASEEITYVDSDDYDTYDSVAYDESEYDDAEYTAYEWEEDEYIYSKRINRFNRTSRNLGYYGSYYNSGLGYSDFGYYNRFNTIPLGAYGGNNIIVNLGNRNSRFNSFGFNNFATVYDPFGNPFNRGFNRGFGNSFGNGFGGFGGGVTAFGGAAYCPPSYYTNTSNRRGVTNNAVSRPSVSSARYSGSTVGSTSRSTGQRASARSTTSSSRANTSTTRRSPRTANSARTSSRNSSIRTSTRSNSSRSYSPRTSTRSSSRSYSPSRSSSRSSSIRSSSRSSAPRSTSRSSVRSSRSN